MLTPLNGSALAAAVDLSRPLSGVAVRLLVCADFTYEEIWQQGEGFSPAGVRVGFRRTPRSSSEIPDVLLMGARLARTVSHLDREGWRDLR